MKGVLRILYAWGLILAMIGMLNDYNTILLLVSSIMIGVGSAGWSD